MLTFFTAMGLFTPILFPGLFKINAIYIVKVLGTFMNYRRKEAHDDVSGVVLSLGKCSNLQRCCCVGFDGGQMTA
jgi:hypothetical protein